jgi:hypothetical protein
MKMGKKDPIYILPFCLGLGQTLHSASSSIEQKLLVTGLNQDARTEAVHHGYRTSRAKQSHLYLLGKRGVAKYAAQKRKDKR